MSFGVSAAPTDIITNTNKSSGTFQGFKILDGAALTIQDTDQNKETIFDAKDVIVNTDNKTYNLSLYLKGKDSNNRSSLAISTDKLTFNNHTSGSAQYHFVGWQDGYSDITINANEIYLGEANNNIISDRGFQFKNSNNTLTVLSKRLVAYVGDTLINAQAGNGSSKATFGTEDNRIEHFEAHNTVGKNDYGVALLQTNEGNRVSLYAVDAILDGPTSANGGVLGSGSWGNLVVDVSNKLTINGNICGSYGKQTGDISSKTAFLLDIKAKELSMTGDINSGFNGSSSSIGDRTTIINLDVGEGSKIDGKVNAEKHGNIGIVGNLTVNGDVIAKDDSNIVLGGRINFASDKNDGSEEIKTEDTYGLGTVTITQGDISVKNTGNITVGGNLIADNSTVTVSTDENAQKGFTLAENAQASVKNVDATDNSNLALNTNSLLKVSEASKLGTVTSTNATVYVSDKATAEIASLDGPTTILFDSKENTTTINEVKPNANVTAEGSSTFANSYASAEEAAKDAVDMVKGSDSKTVASTVKIQESESNGAYSAQVKDDGTIDTSTATQTVNTKTARIGKTAAMNILAWRLENDDMNKRLGELRDSEGNTGLWARVNAGKQKYDGDKNNFEQLQFGADTQIAAIPGVHVGGAFSYTYSDLSYEGGDGNNKIFGLSAYASWLGEQGSFVDLVAKVARLESDSTILNTTADFNTTAYSLSAEVGHRFDLNKLAFIEPQLQLTYGHVDSVNFNTVNKTSLIAAETKVDSVNSLVGRAGFRAGLVCPNQKGNAYVRASVLREFNGDITVTRGDGAYKQDMGDTWFEYGIGGNYNLSPNTQIYAEFERTAGADLSEPWRFNIGARWAF